MVIKRKYLILVSLCGLLIAVDQLTKIYAVEWLHMNQSMPIWPGFFNLTLIHNPGAAFGMLANLPTNLREPFFLVVPLATLAAILFAFVRLKETQAVSIVALSLIVGGAIGNLIDRVRLGFVVDFLDFHWAEDYHFPAFNAADSAITIGVGLLMLSILLEKDNAENT